jgi:hypothetical protein
MALDYCDILPAPATTSTLDGKFGLGWHTHELFVAAEDENTLR